MAFWVSAGARTHGLRRLGPASPASRLLALLGLDGAGAALTGGGARRRADGGAISAGHPAGVPG